MAWKLKDHIPESPKSVEEMIEGDLDEVEELDLDGEELHCLPPDLSRLPSLRKISALGNKLTDLPVSLGGLHNLEILDLSHNEFSNFPHPLLEVANLGALDLSNNKLTSVPPELGRLRKLNTLHLQRNLLTDLPDGLVNLPLIEFSCSLWTPSVGHLLAKWSGLRTLTLDQLPPETIETALSLVPHLESLSLINNNLTEAPAAFSSIHLRRLVMVGHRLRKFPAILHMQEVNFLALLYCGLTRLPPELGQLTSLDTLNLYKNELTTLPRQLADLSDDLHLTLGGNPLTPPLYKLAKQGTKPLFDYLRSLPNDPVAEPDPSPEEAAEAVPEQQRAAPVRTQVVGGVLDLGGALPPADVAQRELAEMHAEVLDWAQLTAQRVSNNHPLVYRVLQQVLDRLGEDAERLQVLGLAFTADRLKTMLDGYQDHDGSDPLSNDQRVLCNSLLGNIGMLLNWTQEWGEYKKKASQNHHNDEARELVGTLLAGLNAALKDNNRAATPRLQQALEDVAAIAAAEPTDVHVQGATDTLHNSLSPLARLVLLVPEKDRAEIRKTAVQYATKATITAGLGLAAVAGHYFLSQAQRLLALAASQPMDFGWLRQVIAALKNF